ncbi:Putative RNA-binding protein 11 [Eufriesea mexicana]|uniref:RNA-binding protein 11 n=1 Tax=Eufriesea mexicana TaxID=516756 RepID=A0A310S4E5_9HYME|nr:PREDICTED: splicing regulator RBM11 [Eufriesea mexicana]OAD52052.1 Putative RNA-binding protein 11 [Eufriesea mexicana]
MDEDMRTLWCGNLSEKVTEEILYELFLQGGPVQKVSIPKHPNGKQRSYGFVIYKHITSVSYALELFDGTCLYNRPLNISLKKNIELSQITQPQDHFIDFNHWLQLGEEVLLGNDMSHLKGNTFGMNMIPTIDSRMKQTDNYSYKDDRRSRRVHPYNREQHKSSNHHKRSHYSKHDYRSSRHNY